MYQMKYYYISVYIKPNFKIDSTNNICNEGLQSNVGVETTIPACNNNNLRLSQLANTSKKYFGCQN